MACQIHPNYNSTRLSTEPQHAVPMDYPAVYNRFWPELYIHAHKISGDAEEAMDIVQDVFLELWLKSRQGLIVDSLKDYLFIAIRNTSLNTVVKKKRIQQHFIQLKKLTQTGRRFTDETISFRETTSQIANGITSLPPRMKEIFQLSRQEGLTHQQIAVRLDITEGAVKKSIQRTLRKFRLEIAGEHF